MYRTLPERTTLRKVRLTSALSKAHFSQFEELNDMHPGMILETLSPDLPNL
jgi:hypothetical protein